MNDKRYKLDELCINTIRMLAVDMVEKAKSGHPGLPLGAAPIAYVLWAKFLRHNPDNPAWPNRDRFILSAGHGSALLYALLHLTGYDLSMEEITRFRQWGSKTPGHPEYGLAPGVEATTGPLGQGFGMGVGLALAESFLAKCFNRTDFPIVDHYTYAIVSDGDIMEGVASEAASLAGHLRLGKLIYLYDDNHISIEGKTEITFTEDVHQRFAAYGWQVIRVSDGNEINSIEAAIRNAQAEHERPSLIIVRTHIGYGSPKQDSPAAHGEPLGPEAAQATKEYFDWPMDKPFYIPEKALTHFRKALERGRQWNEQWQTMFKEYSRSFPAEAASFEKQINGELPAGWEEDIPVFSPEDASVATREASGKVMNALAKRLPQFLGGSADLAPSTKTLLIGYEDRNLHFGVREHAMGAIVNGMALHGGVIPYGATFLVFSDYMRPALRLASLMDVHSVFIFTHDSIALGEDGPTHQPVEHLAALRAIPGFTVIRPADPNETAAAWRLAIQRRKPVALILTRQKVPILDTSRFPVAEGVAKGAYILADSNGTPHLILIATGSEVHLALAAREKLLSHGIQVRVVSMPSWELFFEQPQGYRDLVLPPEIKARLAIEAGSSLGWYRWIGEKGQVISVDRFGASAPGPVALEKYGFNVENIVTKATAMVRR